jgi:lysophospholipase L1-like esterase
MHGWPHSEKEYKEAFPEFLATIRDHAPGAKLIWANTTSLKMSPSGSFADQTQATDERIAARNDIAVKFVKSTDVDVNDLYSLGKGHPEYHTDNVHFNELGIALQAAQVADHIEKLLNK